ncbi:MAG: hypothetical protein LBJ02_01430 [Bifidobacteriaceae bacterium]|nr:hypothetical protein [Bifidobacteriaceae bacterium]
MSALVALVGCIWHRSSVSVGPVGSFPLGLIFALAALAGWAMASRALAGWAGLAGAAVGAFIASEAAAMRGPGGDLMVQGDLLGFIWAIAAPLVVVVAALLPARWFSNLPRRL